MFLSPFTMKTLVIFLLPWVYCQSKSLEVRTSLNSTLAYIEVFYNDATPMEDDIHFSDPTEELIKGIKVEDLGKTNTDIATITAGGVGHNFVHISLRSEPGDSLNYQIEIYS